jgi:prepilin signal peptidase PulO-like enzyme (type II secretory pathway)
LAGGIRELWIAYPLIAILIILSVSDLKYRLLPNKIIAPSMAQYVLLRLWIHASHGRRISSTSGRESFKRRKAVSLRCKSQPSVSGVQ